MRLRKCIDCLPGSRRKAPHPGPRCASHNREVTRARRKLSHSRRVAEQYNLPEVDYWRLYEAQGGRCAICQRAKGTRGPKLSVDHDHRCCHGAYSCGDCVRGLLCRTCNAKVLGHLRDDVDALQRAIDYLKDPPMKQLRRQK